MDKIALLLMIVGLVLLFMSNRKSKRMSVAYLILGLVIGWMLADILEYLFGEEW